MTAVTFNFLAASRDELVGSQVPSYLWPALYRKLENEIYDAGDHFSMMKVVEDDEDGAESCAHEWRVLVTDVNGISLDDENCIFLVDHAWSYSVSSARQHLVAVPGLLDRMAEMMDVDVAGKDRKVLVEEVFAETWRYSQYYEVTVPGSGDSTPIPVWYIVDEFGCRIQHSDTPSFKMAPLYYAPRQVAYSVLWPITGLKEGDEVTRDYVAGHVTAEVVRRARLLPWQPGDLTNVDCDYVSLGADYFSEHCKLETLPDLTRDFPAMPCSCDRPLLYYTDIDLIKQYLTDDSYKNTDDMEEADIIWTNKHFTGFKDLSERHPGKFVNQFPCEFILTSKNLLAITCRTNGRGTLHQDTLERSPAWLPATYSLKDELPQFVSYYQQRHKKGLDNVWICKPWNLARGMDMHITDNLDYIVRLSESAPKVVCKYIQDPVLFDIEEVGAVKFDVRYIVCLSRVAPLSIHVYNTFWLRFANKEYLLDHFDDYEKHFTVMNYVSGAPLRQINCDEFIRRFEAQYSDYPWSCVQEDIFHMLRQIFELAVSEAPPRGICAYPRSRALYAVDLMLTWKRGTDGTRTGIQPMVCEVNFSPDNTRGCKYHPDFYNHMFNLLFRGISENFTEIM